MLSKTRLGEFVSSMANVKVLEVEKSAYNDSVLVQMADLNTKFQLDELGVFSDGTDTPDYSPFTIEMKKIENKLYSHMNFDDTGETRSSINYSFNGELRVDYQDRHNLESKYGPVFGLAPKSIEEIQPEITENIIDFITEKL